MNKTILTILFSCLFGLIPINTSQLQASQNKKKGKKNYQKISTLQATTVESDTNTVEIGPNVENTETTTISEKTLSSSQDTIIFQSPSENSLKLDQEEYNISSKPTHMINYADDNNDDDLFQEFECVNDWFNYVQRTPELDDMPNEVFNKHMAAFQHHVETYGHLFKPWETNPGEYTSIPLDTNSLGSSYNNMSLSFSGRYIDPSKDLSSLLDATKNYKDGSLDIDLDNNQSILRKIKRVLNNLITDHNDHQYENFDKVFADVFLDLNGINRALNDTSFDDETTKKINMGNSFNTKREQLFSSIYKNILDREQATSEIINNTFNQLKEHDNYPAQLVKKLDIHHYTQLLSRAIRLHHIKEGDIDNARPEKHTKPNVSSEELLAASILSEYNEKNGLIYLTLLYKHALLKKILNDMQLYTSLEINFDENQDEADSSSD